MMKTLSQNSVNDIYLDESGQISISDGIDAYADIVADVIRTIKGEIQLDPGTGIDYFGTVFKSVSRTNIWKYYVVQAVSNLPFVKGITRFNASFNPTDKSMKYNIVITTDNGSVAVSS